MQRSRNPEEKVVMDALKRLNDIQTEYLKKFGEHSLNYVIICDPTWMNADNFNKGARMLENAIKSNSPLPNENSELFKSLVF